MKNVPVLPALPDVDSFLLIGGTMNHYGPYD